MKQNNVSLLHNQQLAVPFYSELVAFDDPAETMRVSPETYNISQTLINTHYEYFYRTMKQNDDSLVEYEGHC